MQVITMKLINSALIITPHINILTSKTKATTTITPYAIFQPVCAQNSAKLFISYPSLKNVGSVKYAVQHLVLTKTPPRIISSPPIFQGILLFNTYTY